MYTGIDIQGNEIEELAFFTDRTSFFGLVVLRDLGFFRQA